jgi:hypothetical protein
MTTNLFKLKGACIYVILSTLISLPTFAQTIVQFRAYNSNGIPSAIIQGDGNCTVTFGNSILTNLFSQFVLVRFERSYLSADNSYGPLAEELRRVYEVELSNKSSALELYNTLLQEGGTYYHYVYLVDPPIPTYQPNDYQTGQTAQDLINVKSAWDITHGSSDINIAIVECCNGFDLNHQDLITQIDYNTSYNDVGNFHGTAVAGCAAAATDNGLGISGTGFNCKLWFYTGGFDDICDASNLGAKVVNCSWITGSCNYNQNEQDIINEVYANGTIVVAGAGNGLNGTSCGADGNGLAYPASYEHVISVTSVGHIATYGSGTNNWKDVHPEVISDPINTSHTHNTAVDVCAPGYNV